MARPFTENSNTGPRDTRSAKGRGRGSAGRETENAIESSSLRPVALPAQPVHVSRPTPVEVEHTSAEVEPIDRREEIARLAYYRAEQRGFAPGFELDDWLEAERQLMEKQGATDLR